MGTIIPTHTKDIFTIPVALRALALSSEYRSYVKADSKLVLLRKLSKNGLSGFYVLICLPLMCEFILHLLYRTNIMKHIFGRTVTKTFFTHIYIYICIYIWLDFRKGYRIVPGVPSTPLPNFQVSSSSKNRNCLNIRTSLDILDNRDLSK